MRDDFAVFILCHGRPDNVITWDTLKKCGYTGKIYIILDNQDKTIEGYQSRFGKENCLIFDKEETRNKMDPMDLMHHMKCAVYARNACYHLAKENGIKYFCQIDDDMVDLAYRTSIDGELKRQRCYQADKVFESLLNFLNTNDNLYSVAIAQPGDYIGGKGSTMARNQYKRKCMNFWMCDVDKWLQYNGTLNDDVNTYYINGFRGKLFYTIGTIMTDQPETQSVSGGMSDIYLQLNTYVKSFYPVMLNPSACKVSVFRSVYPRIHHKIFEEHAYPRLISDRFKIKEE